MPHPERERKTTPNHCKPLPPGFLAPGSLAFGVVFFFFLGGGGGGWVNPEPQALKVVGGAGGGGGAFGGSSGFGGVLEFQGPGSEAAIRKP